MLKQSGLFYNDRIHTFFFSFQVIGYHVDYYFSSQEMTSFLCPYLESMSLFLCSEFLCPLFSGLYQYCIHAITFSYLYFSTGVGLFVCMSVCTVHHCTWACYLQATFGVGSRTEQPEGPNFSQLPNPSLPSLFPCLLALQEYASQVLCNLHAALLPPSTP